MREECCKNCFYNLSGRCTVVPGNWDNLIPSYLESHFRCKDYKSSDNSKKLLEEKGN